MREGLYLACYHKSYVVSAVFSFTLLSFPFHAFFFYFFSNYFIIYLFIRTIIIKQFKKPKFYD